MRKLPMPIYTSGKIIDLCVSSIRDKEFTARLMTIKPLIEAIETKYAVLGLEGTLYLIKGAADVDGVVTSGEMERVYGQTFVRSKKTRHVYDVIKSTPEHGICPLCGQRTVSTIDHYLPQSEHPSLVVTPANLVPACAECNKIKLAFQAEEEGGQTLHPYFDDFDGEQWLFATVREQKPVALVFSVCAPTSWSEIKSQRIHAHFKTFGLAALYGSHAGVELSNIQGRLQMMAERSAPDVIRAHLQECEESCARVQMNSWQRATYLALASSEWFYSGGFVN